MGESGGYVGLQALDQYEKEIAEGMEFKRQRLMELRRELAEIEAGLLRLDGALSLVKELRRNSTLPDSVAVYANQNGSQD